MPDYDCSAAPLVQGGHGGLSGSNPARGAGRSVEPGGVDRVYPLFSPRRPPASPPARAHAIPSGEILIVTYDLPLDEVAKFTTTVATSPRGLMFVLTDDGKAARAASR